MGGHGRSESAFVVGWHAKIGIAIRDWLQWLVGGPVCNPSVRSAGRVSVQVSLDCQVSQVSQVGLVGLVSLISLVSLGGLDGLDGLQLRPIFSRVGLLGRRCVRF